MATIQEIAPAPWRKALQPAKYGGVVFHVESQARSGGRRVVAHEYPKRDTPYSEDMGRAMTRYQVTGYLIGPSYHQTKRNLIKVLESGTANDLVDPYYGSIKCICDRYSVTETRERGGYCTFEMSFLEVGSSGNSVEQTNSQTTLQNKATDTGNTTASNVDVPNVVAPPGAAGIGHA
jgi:prophage DNA circulation protein